MKIILNRYDKICIFSIVLCALLLYIPLFYKYQTSKDEEKEVVVHYKDQEVLRVPLNVNRVYTVQGSNGTVLIEVKECAVRVEKETSPLHLCSIQGWVDQSDRPIVCLPNHIVVVIESKNGGDVDTVIQ